MIILKASTPEHFAAARELFIEYQQFLDVDLCFQSFEKELNELPVMYGAPNGVLLLARDQDAFVGCVALRQKTGDVCEMKRLFVKDSHKKQGIGKKLVNEIITEARLLNYNSMILDTLEKLQPAIHLYKTFGFIETGAYYNNPLTSVLYLSKQL